ncbi:MAG: TolC family protein [Gammaproteobacteria bacterium]|nr:TolC family protein [Gammaproteobacteria bacterium]
MTATHTTSGLARKTGHLFKGGVTVLSALLIAGCAIKSEPLTDESISARIASDQAALFSGQEAISGPLGLGEAIVRSVRYNLDSRVKFMELAVATRQLDFSEKGLLPDLVASAGYNRRDNDPGARSINTETGEESLPPSRSQERTRETRDPEFLWNVLDFGMSYHTARQSSAEVEIAKERQRKTMQNIVQDVVDAYWKAWIAQELEGQMGSLIGSVENALNQSNTLAQSQSQSRQEALRYQASLLSIRNSLYEMQERMGLAKIRLAALINEHPQADFTLSSPSADLEPQDITRSYDSLSENALMMRPELREEDYRKRISQIDVKKAMLGFLPQLQIGYGVHADENEFLINDSWEDFSWDLSWNILGLFGVNAEKKFRRAQVDLADARRLALSMAVMTQVRLSMKRYELSLQRYRASQELTSVNMEYAQILDASSRETDLDKIKANADALVSQLRTNYAYAETQAAFARVLNSIGLDITPDMSGDVASAGSEFEQQWISLNSEYF